MKMDRIHNRPGYLLRRAQQISDALFFDECNYLSITPVQYAAMVSIEENPGIDATRLSTMIAFDRSTLGGVIERLEAKDLIRREPSDSDKRAKLLYITDDGRRALREIEPHVGRVQDRILGPLEKPEQEMLKLLLGKLIDLHSDTLPLSLQLSPSAKRKRDRGG